jgi:hypothetical protein
MTIQNTSEAAEQIASTFRALRRHGFKLVRADARPTDAAVLRDDALAVASSLLGLNGNHAAVATPEVAVVARSITQNFEKPLDGIAHPNVSAVFAALIEQTKRRGGSPSFVTIAQAAEAVADLVTALEAAMPTLVRFAENDEDVIRAKNALDRAHGLPAHSGVTK